MRSLKAVSIILGVVFLIGFIYFSGVFESNNKESQAKFLPQVNEGAGISFTATPLVAGSDNPVKLEIKIDLLAEFKYLDIKYFRCFPLSLK